MRLTPLDIKKQDFKRVMRGVDAEEVQAFLEMVADQWQELVDEQNKLEHKITELETKLEHYKQVEEALQEAVRTARESSRQTLDAANNKAQSILEAATESAERLQRKAQEDQYDLRREIGTLRSRRREAVVRLRNLLRSELEMLEDFDRQYPIPAEPDAEVTTVPQPPQVELGDPEMQFAEDAEEAEAVRDIEALESVATSEERTSDEGGHSEEAYSENTLVFTAGDEGTEHEVPHETTHIEASEQPEIAPAADAQPAEDVALPRESHREPTEMDKIRKILDDLA